MQYGNLSLRNLDLCMDLGYVSHHDCAIEGVLYLGV